MGAALPFLQLGLGVVGAGVGLIQGADAAGEAKKQADLAKQAQDKVLADATRQEEEFKTAGKKSEQRDAQLSQLNADEGAVKNKAMYDSSYKGPSMFGTSGFPVASKSPSLFGI